MNITPCVVYIIATNGQIDKVANRLYTMANKMYAQHQMTSLRRLCVGTLEIVQYYP